MSQNRDMSGALFRNNKDGNEARPDYRGDVTIGGTTYRLAAWVKEGRNGKFLSLKVSEDQPRPERDEKPRSNGAGAKPLDDEIPVAPMRD